MRKVARELAISLLSLMGIILTLTEIVLESKATSLCNSTGCHLTHEFDAYHILPYLGYFVFLIIFLLSTGYCFINLKEKYRKKFVSERKEITKILSIILTTALTAEGYFTGFQAFFTHRPCYFCLGVFLLILAINCLFWFRKGVVMAKPWIYPFVSFVTVLTVMFLVPVNLQPFSKEVPVVIYEKGCSHCEKLMKELTDKDVVYVKVPYQSALPFLVKLGIDRVPVVVKSDRNKIEVVMGTECGEKLLIRAKKENGTGTIFERLPFFSSGEGMQGEQACTIGKPCK